MDMDEEKSRGTDSQENTVNDSSGDITYHYTRPQYGQYRFHEEQQTTREDQDEEDTSKVKVTLEDKDRKPVPFKKKLAATIALAVIFGMVAGTVFQATNILSQKYFGTASATDTKVSTTESVPETVAASDNTTDTSSVQDTANEKGTVAAVAKATMPSVVAITSVSIQEITSFFGYGMEYPSTGSGSGIIVGENDDELLIATNNHVIEGATTLSVCFIGDDVVNAEKETKNAASGDGDINIDDAVSAKIKGTDETNDLAVIAVEKKDIPEDTMSEIKIAQLGSSDDLVVGEQVVAIGNALGYGQTVTSGWVSALNRTITLEEGSTASNLIQTDAAINPGNSGGALLNMKGELIGINCAKYASSDVEGTGYAIPISKAQPILEDLMNRKTRDKVSDSSKAGYLDVEVTDLTAGAIQMYNMPSGAFVMRVTPGGAAEQAGIQKNDIIVKFDGQTVSGRSDLVEKLSYYTAGETIDVVVARPDDGEYKEQTISVTLASRDNQDHNNA